MKVRLECTAPGLEGNWIDLAEVWTRAEMREWVIAAMAGMVLERHAEMVERKLLAVHVSLPDGTLITDAKTLIARFDDLDMRLVSWLATGISQAINELAELGKTQKRLLFDGVEVAARTRQTPAP